MRLLPRSLQARLLALVLGAVLAVWLSTVAATWHDARHEIGELLDSHLAQAAALLVVQQMHPGDDDRAEDAPALHPYGPKVAFQVFHNARLVMRSANAPTAPMAPDTEPDSFATVTIDGVAWRVFTSRGHERDVRVFVGERLGARADILLAVLRNTLAPMALALPLLALAVWAAVRYGTRPLRGLGAALATRDPRALEPLALAGAPAEVAPVIDALNRLFARIEAMVQSERRFTDDAAHELRTPIAAIRAQAQVALAATDEPTRRHALRGTLEGCDRAARLVDQLLTLARLEGGVTAPASTRVDLGALTRRVAADLAPAALARGQTLELDAADACAARGDETLLTVLVRNLVDNAVRYAGSGARIRIGVRRDDGGATLHVEDSGPGLTPQAMQALGTRFFRVPGSAESGSGLGWSIVRRIAAAHDARVVVDRSAALGGLEVRVTWPAGAEVEGRVCKHLQQT